jgi:hypothetical protein
MVAVRSSDTSVNFYQTIRHHIPGDSTPHSQSFENLSSHTTQAMTLLLLHLKTGDFASTKKYFDRADWCSRNAVY